jgi:hypothetical protein
MICIFTVSVVLINTQERLALQLHWSIITHPFTFDSNPFTTPTVAGYQMLTRKSRQPASPTSLAAKSASPTSPALLPRAPKPPLLLPRRPKKPTPITPTSIPKPETINKSGPVDVGQASKLAEKHGLENGVVLRRIQPRDLDMTNTTGALTTARKFTRRTFWARNVMKSSNIYQLSVVGDTALEAYESKAFGAWNDGQNKQADHLLYPGGPLKKDSFDEEYWYTIVTKWNCRYGKTGAKAIILVTPWGQFAFGTSERGSALNGEELFTSNDLDIISPEGTFAINGQSIFSDGRDGQLVLLIADDENDVAGGVEAMGIKHYSAGKNEYAFMRFGCPGLPQTIDGIKRQQELHRIHVEAGRTLQTRLEALTESIRREEITVLELQKQSAPPAQQLLELRSAIQCDKISLENTRYKMGNKDAVQAELDDSTGEVERLQFAQTKKKLTRSQTKKLKAAEKRKQRAQKNLDAMESVHKTNEQRLLMVVEHVSNSTGAHRALVWSWSPNCSTLSTSSTRKSPSGQCCGLRRLR